MIEIQYDIDADRNRVLADTVFEDEEFKSLTLANESATGNTLLKNVQFLNCSSIGAAWVRKGVILENVTFVDVDGGDALQISSESVKRNVKVCGRRPANLFVEPQDKESYQMPPQLDGEHYLDISEFKRHVHIVGFPGASVKKNPERHVTIKASWKNTVDWKGLGIAPAGFWRLHLRNLEFDNIEEGVFGLPNPKYKDRLQSVLKEKALLEKEGLCFD